MTDIKPSGDASPHYYQFVLIQNAREAYSENGQAPREVGKQDSQDYAAGTAWLEYCPGTTATTNAGQH